MVLTPTEQAEKMWDLWATHVLLEQQLEARLKAAGQLEGNQTPRGSQANPAHAKTQHRQRVCVVSAYFYPVLFDKCRDKDFVFIRICIAPNGESPISAKV